MKIKNLFLCFMLYFFCFTLSHCATHKTHALSAVRLGMDKADVLEIMGNPAHTSREHNQDRWTYEIRSSESSGAAADTEMAYVFFDAGKVSYIGSQQSAADVRLAPDNKNPSDSSRFKPVGE